MDTILIASLIGLLGVIVGTVSTSINNLFLKSKETKLRILEKNFDKRILAHEDILSIAKEIRSVISLGVIDDEYNLITYPKPLNSKEDLNSFMSNIFSVIHLNSHWLNTNLERELGFLQDYLTSLHLMVENINDKDLITVGVIVKQDFIDLASNLENMAFDFFRKDIYKIKINKHDEWHKYPKKETLRRLGKTNLQTKRQDIEALKVF